MKRKLISIVLVLCLALSLSVVSFADGFSPKTIIDVTDKLYVPIPQNLGEAEIVEIGDLENGNEYVVYGIVDVDSIFSYIQLCSFCGLYPFFMETDNGTIIYMFRPGYEPYVSLSVIDSSYLMVIFPSDFSVIFDDELDALYDYYMQDLVLPTGYGPNVYPEVFASLNCGSADKSGLMSSPFNVEGKDMCWWELYTFVEYDELHKYLSDMMLCGFEVLINNISANSSGEISDFEILLSNDSSEVLLYYFADSEMLNVYYEPGVNRLLLSGSDYAKYIPQP